MNYEIFIIPIAYCLDLALGDPQTSWHPVRLIGKLIEALETILNKPGYNRRFRGIVLVFSVTATAAFVVWGILQLCAATHRLIFYMVSVLFIYFSLSVRSLAEEVNKVKSGLENGDISRARDSLAMIVGRDTKELDESEIIRATVETVAESTMDGIVAPLFYAFLGGPVLVWVYKTINTLDSMVGYNNKRFKEFGWASARLDGLFNLIPAKLTALLISAAMFFYRKDSVNSLRWALKHAFKSPAFNADTAEAPMAGGLRIKLGGINFYNSLAVYKPYLGDGYEPLAIKHINQSLMVSYMVSILMLSVGWMIGLLRG